MLENRGIEHHFKQQYYQIETVFFFLCVFLFGRMGPDKLQNPLLKIIRNHRLYIFKKIDKSKNIRIIETEIEIRLTKIKNERMVISRYELNDININGER